MGLKIRSTCPSLHRDVDLYFNNNLIGRTQGKYWNIHNSHIIYDCHVSDFFELFIFIVDSIYSERKKDTVMFLKVPELEHSTGSQ